MVALAVLAIGLVVAPPSQARAVSGHGFAGGHPGVGVHHGFDGHHRFDRGGHFGFRFGPVYPYFGYRPPLYGYRDPAYWYYCPSYGAYYPSVASCPDAWVPVPAA